MVTLELAGHDTLSCEVQLDVLQSLLGVQADLDASSSRADTLHVILVEGCRDDVFGAGHFLYTNQVGIARQILQHKVDNLDLSRLAHSVVCIQGGLSSDGVVAGKHGLLSRLGLVTRHCKLHWLVVFRSLTAVLSVCSC